jgi:hypothetical protein
MSTPPTEPAHSAEIDASRVTDLSPGSGMHFTDPLPRKWPDNAGKRVRCVCDLREMCMAHAAQRDAATRVTPPAVPQEATDE